MAAVGITLAKTGEAPLLHAGVPVRATNSSRAEVLGPALASLLLAVAGPRARGQVTFTGDSQAVVDLLHCSVLTEDLFLFNCHELVMDMLRGWGVRAVLVPCD